MKDLSRDIEDALKSVIEGLRIRVTVDFVDEDKLQATMNSKVSSFQSAKRLMNRWTASDNAPSKEKQRNYATQLVDAGSHAIDNLREALSKDINYKELEAHKYDKAIKAKPVILEAILDIEAAMLDLQIQLQEDTIDFGEKEFKVGYPEKFARGDMFPITDYWKTWYSVKNDAVKICPKSSEGELITIDELNILLPRVPRNKKEILFWDRHKTEQYWRRQEIPENITPDNVDKFHDYIIEEFRRRREGIWFYNKGVPTYLTGNHYFALQYCKMKDNNGYMDFRIAQWKMFLHMEACFVDKRCLGQLFLKSRRTGFTYIALSILLNRSTSTQAFRGGMTSKSGDDVEETFEKFSYMFLNLPFYFRPVVKGKEDSLTELNFSMPSDNTKAAKKSRKMDISNYLNTLVDHRPTKNGAYDSTKLNFILSDESAKWPPGTDYIAHLSQVRPTLMPGGKVVGKMLSGSTMGSLNKGGEQFKELIELSKLSKRNDVTKKTPTGLYFSFLPAQSNLEEFTDKWGFCHEETPPPGTLNIMGDPIVIGSIEYLMAVEEGLKGNDIALNEQYRTYPRTVQHALRDDATQSTFNTEKIYAQLDYNRDNGIKVVSGNFEWSDGVDSDVEWHPSPKGRFKISWIPSMADDTLHLRNNVKRIGDKFYPVNSYGVLGVDPFSIKATVGVGSKGAIHGKTGFNIDGAPQNKFFLEYIARPPEEEIFFEDVIKACRFYGIPALVESNRIDLLRHMRNRGYRKFSMNRVDKTTKELNLNDLEYGGQTLSSAAILDSHKNGVGAYIERFVGYSTNEEVRPLDEIGEMPFEETLLDWLKFTHEKRTQHDATISSGLAIMGTNRDHYRKPTSKKDTQKATAFLKKYNNKGSIGLLQKKTKSIDSEKYIY